MSQMQGTNPGGGLGEDSTEEDGSIDDQDKQDDEESEVEED